MASVKERQQRRRARLRAEGSVDATVTVPQARVAELRTLAQALRAGHRVSGRLIPVLTVLKRMRPALEARGVLHAGVFGSVARGEERADSDIDVLLQLDAERFGDALDLIDVGNRIEAELQTVFPDTRIEVADLDSLPPPARGRAEADAVYAF